MLVFSIALQSLRHGWNTTDQCTKCGRMDLTRIKRLNSKNEPQYEINKIEIRFSIKAPRNRTDHIKIHNDIHAFNNRLKSHGYKTVLEQSRSGNAITKKLPPERYYILISK